MEINEDDFENSFQNNDYNINSHEI